MSKRGMGIPGMALLGGVFLWVYGPVMMELFRDWGRDANYSHGYLIPIVTVFLIWQRRSELADLPLKPSLFGLLIGLGAMGLLVVGTAAAEVFTQRVSLVAFLASAALFLCGWKWLGKLAFPLAFLLLAIPMPYVIYYGLTGPLQTLAAKAAVTGLNVLGILAVREGNIIHLPGTTLEVAEACSGIRSLYAFLALGALFARSFPVPPLARTGIFLMTIPLSVVGNAFRVLGSGIGAHVIGPEAAEGIIHELFGLIIFVVALAVLMLIGKGARALWSPAS